VERKEDVGSRFERNTPQVLGTPHFFFLPGRINKNGTVQIVKLRKFHELVMVVVVK